MDINNAVPPFISVIIPARNEEAYLADCLTAVRAQDYAHYEMLVVDNGSTDGTAAIAEAHGARVVHEARAGLPRAREAGRQAAGGEILVYIDADTHMPANYLTTLAQAFTTHSDVIAFSNPYRYYDSSCWLNFGCDVYFFCYHTLYACRLIHLLFGGSFAVRRTALEAIGGFDINLQFFGEDTELSKRLNKVGTIGYLPRISTLTSGRRYQQNGFWKTFSLYAGNFLAVSFFNKPLSQPPWNPFFILRYLMLIALCLALLYYTLAYRHPGFLTKIAYQVHLSDKLTLILQRWMQ